LTRPSHLSKPVVKTGGAMPNAAKLAKKQEYFDKLIDLCVNHPKALLVGIDHVASKQMQDIRIALRGRAVVLMGKNTMIRKGLQIGQRKVRYFPATASAIPDQSRRRKMINNVLLLRHSASHIQKLNLLQKNLP